MVDAITNAIRYTVSIKIDDSNKTPLNWRISKNYINNATVTASNVLKSQKRRWNRDECMASSKFLRSVRSHTYVADDFIAYSRPKTKRSYLYRWTVYAGVSFPLHFFLFPFFSFLIVIHCVAALHLILSPACVQFDISRMERSRYLFFPPFSSSNSSSTNGKCRRRRHLRHRLRIARTIIPRVDVRIRAQVSARAHFHNAAFPSTASVSIILSRIIVAVARPNYYSSQPLSAEFAILSTFLRMRKNKSAARCFLTSSRTKSILIIRMYACICRFKQLYYN